MKTLKGVIITLLTLVVILWLAFSIFAEPVLKSTITTKLTRLPSDSVSIQSIRISLFPFGVKAKDIYFDLSIPKDSVLNHVKGNVESLKIGRINWLKAWNKKAFDIGKLKVENASIEWLEDLPNSAPATSTDSTSEPIPPLLFKNIELKELHFISKRDSNLIKLTGGIEVKNLKIEKNDSLIWTYDHFSIESQNAAFEDLVEDYDLAYQSLRFSSNDSLLEVKSFTMSPRLSRAEFSKKYPYRKPQPKMKLENVVLSGIDLPKKELKLIAKKLLVDSCIIDLYQDIRLERPDKRKPMPSELIAKVEIPLHIDTVVVQHAKLDYHHRPKQEDLGLAHLELDNITLKAFPISNIGHTDCADLNLQITAILENRPRLKLNASFFPDKQHHNFEVDLTMTGTELGAFNDILYPTTGLKIKQGSCTGAHVKMTGNDYSVQGYLDIAYTNLHVALPPNQKEELKFFKKSLEGIGNFAAINTNNEMGNKRGEILYKRPAKEPFVNFWWKGIQGGLMDVITPFYNNPDKKKS